MRDKITIEINKQLSPEELQTLVSAELREYEDAKNEMGDVATAFGGSLASSQTESHENESPAIYLQVGLDQMGTSQETFDYLESALGMLSAGGHDCQVGFRTVGGNVSANKKQPTMMERRDLERIKTFEASMMERGLSDRMVFDEGIGSNYSIHEVERANKVVEFVAKDIKRLGLSPFEAALYIHEFCAGFQYLEERTDLTRDSRMVAGTLNSGYIVCAGYASLFKAVSDKLGMEGLNVGINKCALEQGMQGHANNLVSIVDPKYGMNGETYLEDSCWSSAGKRLPFDFAYCMYPIKDIDNVEMTLRYSQKGFTVEELYESTARGRVSPQEVESQHRAFIGGIEKIGDPIDKQTYARAYFEILRRKGCSEMEAKAKVEEKIIQTIERVSDHWSGKTQSDFYDAEYVHEVEEWAGKPNRRLELERQISSMENMLTRGSAGWNNEQIDAHVNEMERLRRELNELENERMRERVAHNLEIVDQILVADDAERI